jgi:hypothetical protein
MAFFPKGRPIGQRFPRHFVPLEFGHLAIARPRIEPGRLKFSRIKRTRLSRERLRPNQGFPADLGKRRNPRQSPERNERFIDGSGSGDGIFWPLHLGPVRLWRFTLGPRVAGKSRFRQSLSLLRRFMASEVLPDRRQAGSRAGSLSYNDLRSIEAMSQGHAAV